MNLLQELNNWGCESMVRKYAHLAPPQLVEHLKRIANLLNGTNLAQAKKQKGLDIV